jgi:hypothetical protein
MKTLAQLAFEKIPNNKVSRMGNKHIAVKIGPGMFARLPMNLIISILAHEKWTRPRRQTTYNRNNNIYRNATRLGIRRTNNNLSMKYKKLEPNSKKYKEILKRYFTNMHEKLRRNVNVRVSGRNPLVVRIKPFPFNNSGRRNIINNHEYEAHLKSYKQAIMNTKYIHTTPNKIQKLINLFSKSTMNTKNRNIENAFKLYYARNNPRKGVFNT